MPPTARHAGGFASLASASASERLHLGSRKRGSRSPERDPCLARTGGRTREGCVVPAARVQAEGLGRQLAERARSLAEERDADVLARVLRQQAPRDAESRRGLPD